MKILQVYKDVFPEVTGGIERYIHDFSLFLTEKGHSVEIIVAGGGNRKIDKISVSGIFTLCRFLSTPIAPGYLSALNNTDADVIHFHLPMPTAVIAWLLSNRKKKIPYIVTYHSDIVRQAFFMPLYGLILKKFLKNANTVIATSQNYLSSSVYLRDLKNTLVIPIGVDLQKFSPYSVPSRDFYLFVGRFRTYKGIFVLLNAWNQMKKRFKPKLLLVGGGKQVLKISKFIKKNNLPIEILTDIDDEKLLHLYQNAKALILPSILRSEAFGMVQVEAMACGTAVISSNLPTGVSWVNKEKHTGFLFKTGDSVALADAVSCFENGEGLLTRMGENARKRAISLFDGFKLFEQVEVCLKKANKTKN